MMMDNGQKMNKGMPSEKTVTSSYAQREGKNVKECMAAFPSPPYLAMLPDCHVRPSFMDLDDHNMYYGDGWAYQCMVYENKDAMRF